jgi:hypothetical protein
VYDGGKTTTGLKDFIDDVFFDAKTYPDGTSFITGVTADSAGYRGISLFKFDALGKLLWKKVYNRSGAGHSIIIAKNGDLIIGGDRGGSPYLMRLDTAGNIKWSTWYYDTTNSRSILPQTSIINCVHETSRGTFVCAAGNAYPFNDFQPLTNYAVLLEFDSLGRNPYKPSEPCFLIGKFSDESGYRIGGFYVDETQGKNLVLSGYRSVYTMDSLGMYIGRYNYMSTPDGVGTQDNNVFRAKVLRNNTLMVAGQAYETDCWTRFNHLYYNAWWSSSISNSPSFMTGNSREDDYLLDFSQLNNGNLVFVGTKGSSYGYNPIWVFVTDPGGGANPLLFDKRFFPRDSTIFQVQYPRAITATPDNGFTVVGYICQNGMDALAMHFVPKPVGIIPQNHSTSKSINEINVHVIGSRLIITTNALTEHMGEVSMFDISGKRIIMQTACILPLSFDISKLPFGTYFVRVKAGSDVQTIKICLNR